MVCITASNFKTKIHGKLGRLNRLEQFKLVTVNKLYIQ